MSLISSFNAFIFLHQIVSLLLFMQVQFGVGFNQIPQKSKAFSVNSAKSSLSCTQRRNLITVHSGIFPPDDEEDFMKNPLSNIKVSPIIYQEDHPEDLVGFWDIFWEGMNPEVDEQENRMVFRPDGQVAGGPALEARTVSWAANQKPVGGTWRVDSNGGKTSTLSFSFYVPPKREIQYCFEGRIFITEVFDRTLQTSKKKPKIYGQITKRFATGLPEENMGMFDMTKLDTTGMRIFTSVATPGQDY